MTEIRKLTEPEKALLVQLVDRRSAARTAAWHARQIAAAHDVDVAAADRELSLLVSVVAGEFVDDEVYIDAETMTLRKKEEEVEDGS